MKNDNSKCVVPRKMIPVTITWHGRQQCTFAGVDATCLQNGKCLPNATCHPDRPTSALQLRRGRRACAWVTHIFDSPQTTECVAYDDPCRFDGHCVDTPSLKPEGGCPYYTEAVPNRFICTGQESKRTYFGHSIKYAQCQALCESLGVDGCCESRSTTWGGCNFWEGGHMSFSQWHTDTKAVLCKAQTSQRRDCVWVNHKFDRPGQDTCECVDRSDPCRSDGLMSSAGINCPDAPRCDPDYKSKGPIVLPPIPIFPNPFPSFPIRMPNPFAGFNFGRRLESLRDGDDVPATALVDPDRRRLQGGGEGWNLGGPVVTNLPKMGGIGTGDDLPDEPWKNLKPVVWEPPIHEQEHKASCWAACIIMISEALGLYHHNHHISEEELYKASGIDTSEGYGYTDHPQEWLAFRTVLFGGAKFLKRYGRRPQVEFYTGHKDCGHFFWSTCDYQYLQATLLDYKIGGPHEPHLSGGGKLGDEWVWSKKTIDRYLDNNYFIVVNVNMHTRLLWARVDNAMNSYYKFKDPWKNAKEVFWEMNPIAKKNQVDPGSMTWNSIEAVWPGGARFYAVQVNTNLVWLNTKPPKWEL